MSGIGPISRYDHWKLSSPYEDESELEDYDDDEWDDDEWEDEYLDN